MKTALTIALLLPMLALANGNPAPPPDPSNVATSQSTAVAAAAAIAASKSIAAQEQGQEQHQSQAQSQTANGGTATASNAGNAQNLSISETNPRNAPSLGQGSTYIGTCGAGGNAGGSGVNGAGFLGISWTPKDCKLLLAAEAYRSLGMIDAACEMVNKISSVQAAWKERGLAPPDCTVKPTPPPIVVPGPPGPPGPAADLSGYATKEDLDRAFKRSASK